MVWITGLLGLLAILPLNRREVAEGSRACEASSCAIVIGNRVA